MDFADILTFIIVAIVFLFSLLRKNAQKRKSSEQTPQKQIYQKESRLEKPPLRPALTQIKPVNKRTLQRDIGRQGFEKKIETRHLTSDISNDGLVTELTLDPSYQLKVKGKVTRIQKIINQKPTRKNLILLSEILRRDRF